MKQGRSSLDIGRLAHHGDIFGKNMVFPMSSCLAPHALGTGDDSASLGLGFEEPLSFAEH